jgi:hypothetical protein
MCQVLESACISYCLHLPVKLLFYFLYFPNHFFGGMGCIFNMRFLLSWVTSLENYFVLVGELSPFRFMDMTKYVCSQPFHVL